MKKRLLQKGLSLFLTLGLLFSAAPGVQADSGGQGAAAPPEEFQVYVNVDGSTEPTLIRSYSSSDMRDMALQSKKAYMADDTFEKASSNGNIYYTACNSWGELCGRVVTEYVLLSQFFSDLGIEFGENDYLTMGPDYTIDPQYSDYNYGTAQENYSQYWKNYGWYNYNDLCGERSYYQNWKEDSKYRVPAVISLKSYGGSGWTEETYWEMYAGSSDYLWAYVINFGQSNPEDATYHRFYYEQTECTVKFAENEPAESLIEGLLSDSVKTAQTELSETETASEASEVPEDRYWVTPAQKSALQEALTENQDAAGTNGQVYSAYLNLSHALDDFCSVKKAGTKTGYTWFSAADYETTQTYTIRTKNQMAELAELVNGTADFGSSMGSSYDFSGKTILLSEDVDLQRYRIVIGDQEHPFLGTFDGQNHTLSNLNVNRSSGYAALFGNNGGVIRNLTLTGNVSSSVSAQEGVTAPVGGIAAYNSGTIENCRNEADVSAPSAANVGGIAGRNEGLILNCLNAADVTGLQDVGGIAGYVYAADRESGTAGRAEESEEAYSGANIRGCLNAGDVTALYPASEDKGNSNVGGIAGGIGADRGIYPTIKSCINSGDIVTASKTAGGIAGGAWISELTIQNCYSIGSVSTTAATDGVSDEEISSSYNIGAIAGRTKGTVQNCCWIKSSEKPSETGIGYTNNPDAVVGLTALTPEELAAVSDLGDDFRTVTNGYPVLKWQSVYQVKFSVDQEDDGELHSAGEYLKTYPPKDPEIDGAVFDGWFTSSDDTVPFDFDRLITDHTTLFAGFQRGGSGGGSGGGGGGSSSGVQQDSVKDRVTVDAGSEGTVAVSPEKVKTGDTITVEVKPADGYVVDTVTAADGSGKAVDVKDKGNGAYTFTLPEGKVTVHVTYRKTDAAQTGKFTDVASGAWYYEAVYYAADHGYFQGISDTLFRPDGSMTRAMFATVIGRMAGVDESKYTGSAFSDVPEGEWYSAYVKWASENGIVSGVGEGRFSPDSEITREQMAAMLYRYAKFTGADTSSISDTVFNGFADKDTVSAYAKEAMIWATSEGIISGTGSGLSPKSNATRAQVAQILMNYAEETAK